MTTARRSPNRDKRYFSPSLLVDLLEDDHETRLWSTGRLILSDYAGDLAAGQAINAAFRFDADGDCGLLGGKVARLDPARRLLGIEIDWLDACGRALMEAAETRRAAAPESPAPAMRLSFTHATLNWSLTGLLASGFRPGHAVGDRVRGLIRTERVQAAGPFTASIARIDRDPASGLEALALRFQSLPDCSFALLEAAIQKAAGAGGLSSAA